jgi:hypothetical protein
VEDPTVELILYVELAGAEVMRGVVPVELLGL